MNRDRPTPEAVMEQVVHKVSECDALRFSARVSTKFGAAGRLPIPLRLKLGPGRLEGSYRRPHWRIAASDRKHQFVWIFKEGAEEAYVQERENWSRRRLPHPYANSPVAFKLRVLGLQAASGVRWVSMEESVWRDEPVWICRGVECQQDGDFRRETLVAWWIGKSDLLVRKMEQESGRLSFERGGSTHQAQTDVRTVLEVDGLELDIALPEEDFAPPADVPRDDRPSEGPLGWIERLLEGGL